jgi:hypothetical protein
MTDNPTPSPSYRNEQLRRNRITLDLMDALGAYIGLMERAPEINDGSGETLADHLDRCRAVLSDLKHWLIDPTLCGLLRRYRPPATGGRTEQ